MIDRISSISFHIIKALFVFTLLFFTATGCNGNTGHGGDMTTAPDFTLLDLNDEPVSLSDFRGQPVLVNFFATYCPPCRMEMPDFVKLVKKYGSSGFTVIAISVDQNPKQLLPPFISSLNLNFPVLVATSRVLEDYGDVYALPASFMLDRNHRIIKHFRGMVTEEDLIPLIESSIGNKGRNSH
jgi:cytochrome c biogenesis protein CcmG/thiol:disulfide interchange protein DsbE